MLPDSQRKLDPSHDIIMQTHIHFVLQGSVIFRQAVTPDQTTDFTLRTVVPFITLSRFRRLVISRIFWSLSVSFDALDK